MIASIPEGPFFIPAYQPEYGGVDFLGLRQVNLDMMSSCLPGINNVTVYVRAFSLLSWIHWKFHALVASAGRQRPSTEQMRQFRERVEILFTWGHVQNEIGGIPGTTSKPPRSKGAVPLTFASWKRNQDNTSLMAAVQYGPASKTLGGLGFLERVDGEFYRTCGPGVALARALDELISASPAAHLLTLTRQEGSAEDAAELFSAWSVLEPTDEERAAFAKAFFDEGAPDDTEIGRRSGTLALVLRALSASDHPLQEQEIRKAITYARLDDGTALDVPDILIAARLRWFVLQLRQTQRFAMENLFAWLEYKLILQGERDSEPLVQTIVGALTTMLATEVATLPVSEVSRSMIPQFDDLEEFCERSVGDDETCLFAAVERIVDAGEAQDDAIAAEAFRALFLCARVTDLLESMATLRPVLRLGGPDRISLAHFRNIVARCGPMPLEAFVRFCLEGLILSQHFAVAGSRFDGGTQRLRVTIEETGLTPLVDRPWRPVVSADRLRAALALAADCGLIGRDTEGAFVPS